MTTPGGAPPRVLLAASGAVLVVAVAATLAGGWRTGVSWDETYHVLRLRTFLADGWYLLDRDMLGPVPGPWEDQQYVYGPVTTLGLHGWAVLWGVEGWGQVSAAADAFAVRHLGVALVSFAGVAATAGLVRVLLGGWRWPLVGAAVLVAVPTWSGHAMFNVKDVPVATGYTLATLGLVLLARRRTRWAGTVVLLAGLVLAVGTRPGIAPGLAVAAAVALVTRDRWRWAAVPSTVLAAAVVLWAVYPNVFSDPVRALVEGALSSSRFDDRTGAWWYLPLYLVVELPTLHLLLGALGTAVAVRLARARGAALAGDPARRLALVLVLLQALLLPALALVRQANLYTGLRQLLFAAPALAVLVTLALAHLLGRHPVDRDRPDHRHHLHPRAVRALPWVAAAAVVLPLLSQLQLFPYGYAYRSPVANALAPAAVRIDPVLELPTDYWRTSARALAPAVPSEGFTTCSPTRTGEAFSRTSRDGAEDCGTDVVGPLAPYAGLRAADPLGSPVEFAAVVTGSDLGAANCERTASVERRLWFRTLVMGYVATCELVLEPYPAGGLSFDATGSGLGASLGGWDVHRSRPGIGPDGTGTLGVQLPEQWTGRGLDLRATALGAADAVVSANGHPLDLVVQAGTLRAHVPASVADRWAGRLLLEVRDRDAGGGVPDLRLLGLHLAPAAPGGVR